MMHEFGIPTRLVWGVNSLDRLPELAKAIGISRALIVTDKNIAKTAFLQRTLRNFAAEGVQFSQFDDCEIDARLSHIQSQADLARHEKIDGVIGIGGGTIMCTAKGIAAMVRNAGRYDDYRGIGNLKEKPLPNIMVPTTAGSGTEISHTTIIRDDDGTKFVVESPLAFPTIALLDPATLETCPPELAAASAMDALTHAVEAYLSRVSTPITDALAIKAVGLLAGSVVRSIKMGEEAARSDHLLGSTIANMAVGAARVGMAHSLAGPLESAFHISHGAGVGVLMPQVVAATSEAVLGKVQALAQTLGSGPINRTQAVARFLDRTHALYDSIDFPTKFDPKQVERARIREMVESAYLSKNPETSRTAVKGTDRIVAGNGHTVSVEEAEAILGECVG